MSGVAGGETEAVSCGPNHFFLFFFLRCKSLSS